MSDDEPRAIAQLETGAKLTPIIPRNVEEVARIADAVIAAGMVPASYEQKDGTQQERQRGTKARIMIGIMKGLEVGFGPITALSTIFIVNNRPSIWGDGAVALCERDGKVEFVKHWFEGEEGKDDWTAHYLIKRFGQSEAYKGKFSVKDAKRAHLWNHPKKQPWIEYPQRMLLARARAFALREGFADCLMGLSIAEEVQDLPPEPQAKLDTAFLGPPQDKPVHEEMPGEAEAATDPVTPPAQEPDASPSS